MSELVHMWTVQNYVVKKPEFDNLTKACMFFEKN